VRLLLIVIVSRIEEASPAPSPIRLPVPPLNTSSARVSKKNGGENAFSRVVVMKDIKPKLRNLRASLELKYEEEEVVYY
jgi:hypothetical protein